MTADSIKARIAAQVKPKKTTAYNLWKEAVLADYPDVFFPALSPKKKKILDGVTKALESQKIDEATFYKWIVSNWLVLHKKTEVFAFSKYPYPELDLVLFHYAKLINIFSTSQRVFTNPNPKKKVVFKFFDE